MSLTVVGGKKIKGCLIAPPSKSFLLRAIFCAAFSNEPTVLFNVCDSKDVTAALNAVRTFGARIITGENSFKIYPVQINAVNRAKTVVFDVFDSATVLHFALAFASSLGVPVYVKCSKGLIKRPHESFIKTLNDGGAKIIAVEDGFTVDGIITEEKLLVDAKISSQYLSALLLASPLSLSRYTVSVEDEIVSFGYVKITEKVLGDFGVTVFRDDDLFKVVGNYSSPKKYYTEGDWSLAAAMLSFGLLYGEVSVKGLNANSVQPDAEFLQICNKLGAKIDFLCIDDEYADASSCLPSVFTAKKSALFGIETDIDGSIDLFPTVAVLCSFAKGESIIYGVDRLKYKESDRLFSIEQLLNSGGVKTERVQNGIKIIPSVSNRCEINSFDDHRIVMAATLFGTNKGIDIIGCEAVNKSFPNFFENYFAIGGETVVNR